MIMHFIAAVFARYCQRISVVNSETSWSQTNIWKLVRSDCQHSQAEAYQRFSAAVEQKSMLANWLLQFIENILFVHVLKSR